jgi:hypothetical protein
MNPRRRILQKTITAVDDEGNRLHIPVNMGFGHTFWAKIMSEAIIGAALKIYPAYWIMVRIDNSKETAFEKFIGRRFKDEKLYSEYIVVRTRSLENERSIYSWFFIHRLDANAIADKLPRYSEEELNILNGNGLKEELTWLFEKDMHSDRIARRWDASRHMEYLLRLHRMRYLIELCRDGRDHELIRGLPPRTDFIKRLALYIRVDEPLMRNLKLGQINELLKQTGTVSDEERKAILREIAEYEPKWHVEGSYPGMPPLGAERDRKEGRIVVIDRTMTALSTPRNNPDEEED